MKHTTLVANRKSALTPDTAEALRQVELRGAERGDVRIHFEGAPFMGMSWDGILTNPGPTRLPPQLSMRGSGREVQLKVSFKEYKGSEEMRRQHEVEAMWALAVPCGFTPWLRYPLAGPGDDVFHYYGRWQALYDSVCSEGRGEYAWPSLACAAQVDVGLWAGDKLTERFVQAQLHRLGIPCGLVDGQVGPRTLTAIQALGLKGMNLDELSTALAKMEPPAVPVGTRRFGYFVAPGRKLAASSTGGLALVRTAQGFSVAIDGPGRLVLDIGEPETV